jgi:hypothetical protein
VITETIDSRGHSAVAAQAMAARRALCALLVLCAAGMCCAASRVQAVSGGAGTGALAPLSAPRRRLLASAAPSTSQVLTSPSNCTGWQQKRVYLEGQAWFTRCVQPAAGATGRSWGGALPSVLHVTCTMILVI